MLFADYRVHLKKQKQWIKNKKQGEVYYLAAQIFYAPEDKNQLFGLRETFNPFKGSVKEDLLEPIIKNKNNAGV